MVRSQSGPSQISRHLRNRFGPERESTRRDQALLYRTEDAYVRTLHLTDHTLFPTGSYSQQQTVRSWRELADYIKAHAGGAYESRSMLRVLLQPSCDGWQTSFEQRLTNKGPTSGSGLGRFLLSAGAKDSSGATDPKLVAEKTAHVGFRCEIQVITICEAKSDTKRRARSSLDHITALVGDLAGGRKMWSRTSVQEISGRKLFGDRRNRATMPPLDLLKFLSPERTGQFPLSPEEIAPLWPTPLTTPTPVSPDAVLAPGAAPKSTRPAAAMEAVHAAPGVSAKPASSDDPIIRDESRTTGARPVTPARPTKTERPWPVTERFSFHSAQPCGLPSLVLNRKNLRPKGRGRQQGRDSEPLREVINAVRPDVVRALGLSERDILTMDQLADLPIGSAQDLAYAYGRSPTTSYESLTYLEQQGLALRRDVHIGSTLEKRYWLPDDQWARIMGDRIRSHPGSAIDRLWLNPSMVAAVYRVAGVLVQSGQACASRLCAGSVLIHSMPWFSAATGGWCASGRGYGSLEKNWSSASDVVLKSSTVGAAGAEPAGPAGWFSSYPTRGRRSGSGGRRVVAGWNGTAPCTTCPGRPSPAISISAAAVGACLRPSAII